MTTKLDAAFSRCGYGEAKDMLPGKRSVEIEVGINRLAEIVFPRLDGRTYISLVVLVLGLLIAIVLMLRFAAKFREPPSSTQQSMGGRRQPDCRQNPNHNEAK